jgi:hypothetical protein
LATFCYSSEHNMCHAPADMFSRIPRTPFLLSGIAVGHCLYLHCTAYTLARLSFRMHRSATARQSASSSLRPRGIKCEQHVRFGCASCEEILEILIAGAYLREGEPFRPGDPSLPVNRFELRNISAKASCDESCGTPSGEIKILQEGGGSLQVLHGNLIKVLHV